MEPQDAGASSRVAISELLKSGVTTVTDLSVNRESWLDDLASTGIRAVVCPMYRSGYWYTKNGHEVGYAWDEKAGEAAFAAALKTIDRAAEHPSGRLSGMMGPAQIDTCTEGLFKDSLAEAQRRNIPLQTHACQAIVEFNEMVRRHGKTPIEWLDQIGVLGPDLVIGHGIFLNDHPQIHWPHSDDFARLRDSGAAVAHCPTVFARRGIALNTIGRYMNAGVPVGLGTDTFPHNMVDEMRLACYAARILTGNYKMGTTRHVFEAATMSAQNPAPARSRPYRDGLQGRLLAGRSRPSLHAAGLRAAAQPDLFGERARHPRRLYRRRAGGEKRRGSHRRHRGRDRPAGRGPAAAHGQRAAARLGASNRRAAGAAGDHDQGAASPEPARALMSIFAAPGRGA